MLPHEMRPLALHGRHDLTARQLILCAQPRARLLLEEVERAARRCGLRLHRQVFVRDPDWALLLVIPAEPVALIILHLRRALPAHVLLASLGACARAALERLDRRVVRALLLVVHLLVLLVRGFERRFCRRVQRFPLLADELADLRELERRGFGADLLRAIGGEAHEG